MKSKTNVMLIRNCYGCGVCAIVCSKKIIDIRLNSEGFYEPHIAEQDKCTNCGLCIDVCSYSHQDVAQKGEPLSCYGAWSKEAAVRQKCSSGGVGFELGRTMLSEGYKVCGVRYDVDKGRAEHFVASTVEELIQTIGSKYIQSYTVDGFRQVDRKKKYFITGTPCQIDSFRRYIKKFRCEENFVLMDFFCHGVPSMHVWNKYVKWAETKVGKLTYVSWRNKFNRGWHDSWAMGIDGEEKGGPVDWHESYNLLIREKKNYLSSRLSQGDMFYQMFLGNNCLGKACYSKCKFKYNHSAADIRIGDAWGNTYQSNQKGVTTTIAFTPKGDEILKTINCEMEVQPFEIAAEGQIKRTIPYPGICRKVIIALSRQRWVSIGMLVFCSKVTNKIKRIFG